MILINDLYVSFARDEEINGYYCQVYNDEQCSCEVDNFCIHNCTDLEQAEFRVRLYYEMNFLFE